MIRTAEVDLQALFAELRRRWKLMLGVSVVAVILSIAYLHLAEQRYSITLNVVPVEGDNLGLDGQLSDLALLVGVNLPTDSSETEFQLYKRGLHSEIGASVLMNKPDIVRSIFASEWSETDLQWSEPRGVVFFLRRVAAVLTGSSRFDWRPPGVGRIARYLREEIRVTDDRDSEVSSILFYHQDPEVAKSLLLTLHYGIDNILRQRALDRTNAYIEYLTDKLESTAIAEYRQALAETLSAQGKLLMFASSDAQFAAELFGEIEVSDTPVLPNPVFVLAISIVLGLFLGFVFVVIRMGSFSETSRAEQ